MNTSVNIALVTFPGFYGSIFDEGEEIYNLLYNDFGRDKANELEEGKDYEVDYNGYRNAVGEAWCDVFERLLSDYLDIDCKLEFETIVSPQYYNYSNDRVFADFKIKHFKKMITTKVLPLMRKHKAKLAEMIHEYHTSYDGFISFMKNTYDYWYSYLADSSNYADKDFSLYFEYVLHYLVALEMGGEEKMQDELIMSVCEDNSIYEYITYSDELREMVS